MKNEAKVRVLVVDCSPIAEKNSVFYLQDGYYISEDESVIIKSTNITGKYFKPTEDGTGNC